MDDYYGPARYDGQRPNLLSAESVFLSVFCTCICNCIGFGICFGICIWICVLTRVRCMMMVRGPWSLCFQRTGLRPLAAWHTNCTLGIRVAFRLDMALLVNQFGSATLFDLIWLFDMLDMTCDFWLLIFWLLIFCFFDMLFDLIWLFCQFCSVRLFAADLKLFLSWEFQTEKVFASVYIFQYSYLSLYLQCTFASTMQHISKVAKLSERMALFYMKFEFSKEGYLLQPK